MSTESLRSEPSSRLILLVEDEPVLRASVARGLTKLAGVEVVEAGSVRAAMAALLARTPALVVSDLDLPDGSGIEVAAELERRRVRVPVVFVSAFVGKYRALLPSRADIEVFEKPVPLERLRAIVEERLAGGRDSSPFGVADFVQLAGMGRHSVVIEVKGARRHGLVAIRGGEIMYAVDERGGGMDAFRRLVFAPDVVVTCRAPRAGEAFASNVEGSCESALLEAARVQDESGGELDEAWAEIEPAADSRPEDVAEAPAAFASAEPELPGRPPSSGGWARPEPATPPSGRRAVGWVEEAPLGHASHPVGAEPPSVHAGDARREGRAASPSAEAPADDEEDPLLQRLLDTGLDALLARNYSQAFAIFSEASHVAPGDARVEAYLRRLAQMGLAS